MKKLLLFTALVSLLACSSKKQIEQALHSGNYDQAIEDALRKLENNKDKERKQDFVLMLEDAFYKAVDRDLNDIQHLKKDGNPENYKILYNKYLYLNARQEAIKPVLPLQIGGKTLNLKFNDYTDEILVARNHLSNYLYEQGLALLESGNKKTIRDAYEMFLYLERINPNYEDTRQLIEEAHTHGTDYVIVTIQNQTHQIIPQELEEDLLNFDTYGLNQFWTVYHASASNVIAYDYAMELQLKHINISAEQVHETQLLKEKQIVDGWKYQLDNNGNVAKDSLGNDIKIDNIINVRARFFEYNQFKSSQMIATVAYVDLKQHQTLQTFPIDSQFVFENHYAIIKGDKRALDRNELGLLQQKELYFPSDEQMVFNTGEDLKTQLKSIINSYKLKA